MKKKDIDCPRCLGKGYIDKNDIKRLRREYFWNPGKCAFCKEKKKVQLSFATKINADDWFICINTNENELEKYIARDKSMVDHVNHCEKQIYHMGDFIMYNHIGRGISEQKVLELFIEETKTKKSDIQKQFLDIIKLIKENIIDDNLY